jgi:hypothetical protein
VLNAICRYDVEIPYRSIVIIESPNDMHVGIWILPRKMAPSGFAVQSDGHLQELERTASTATDVKSCSVSVPEHPLRLGLDRPPNLLQHSNTEID